MTNEENSTTAPDDAAPTADDMPSFAPPPPRWSEREQPPADRKMGKMALGIGSALALAVALSIPIAAFTPVGTWFGSESGTAAAATVQTLARSAQSSAAGGGSGLQKGAVFVNANDPKANVVIALVRNPDGTLREYGRYPTGGTGSGTAEDDAGGIILGNSQGESSPIHLIESTELLYVANSASDTVTVFKVLPDRLQKVTEVSSGGVKPVSLTVSRGLLYVLNSGEFDDRAIINNAGLENCSTGQLPSVTGFRVSKDGHLTQIPGSTRLLSGSADSGCAQASFSPDGRTLVVTERIGGKRGGSGLAKGVINVLPVRSDGLLGENTMTEPVGNGPFGFTFTKDGAMLVTEQQGTMEGRSTVVSYTVNDDATLTPNQKSLPNNRSDTCWIVATADGKMAFSSSALGNGAITSYEVSKTGTLKVLWEVASADDGKTETIAADHTPFTLIDLALSRDGQYLYQIGGIQGTVFTFKVVDNGSLTYVGKTQVTNVSGFDLGFVGVPMGIVAS